MEKPTAPVVIVAAMSAERRAIGLADRLLWHIPADLKRFKRLTTGHPVIMGRKTFESILAILGTPLPGRTNIVLTNRRDYRPPGVVIVHSLAAAFRAAAHEEPTEIHIGGGTELYQQALPFVDRLHLTFVHDEPEADTFFPEFADAFVETHRAGPFSHKDLTYEWVDYERAV